MTRPNASFSVPYAVAAPIVALLLAIFGWNFSINARLTTLETIAGAPTKVDSQIAALNQKVMDFQEEYERDRINDHVASAKEGK